MGEFKFSCHSCGQKIMATEQWSGQQIQCPACRTDLIVPLAPAAPPPLPSATQPPPPQPLAVHVQPPPPRPVTVTAHAAPPPPHAHRPAPGPSRPTSAPKSGSLHKFQKKSSPGMTALKVGTAVIGLGVGFYFGFSMVSGWQKETNIKRREVEKNSDGGQVGHIADLYDILDKTDPNRYSRSYAKSSGSEGEMPDIRLRSKRPGADGAAEKELPVLPAVWTMDLNAAQIPEGKANGTITSDKFLVDSARVDVSGTSYVLGLRQGPTAAPDKQVLVYLKLKPGETFAGHSWTVSSDMKAKDVAQVQKLWKPDPRYAPKKAVFMSGYTMKLEFGPMDEYGTVPGKIFIALPDTEQSVVAGLFSVETDMSGMGYTVPTAPGQQRAPMAGEVSPEERQGVVY